MTRRTVIHIAAGLILAATVAFSWAEAGESMVRVVPDPHDRVRPVAEPHQRLALRAVSDCDTLRDYVGEMILENLIQARYWWGPWFGPWSGPMDATESGAGPSDFTTTNTQESGVDELDIVKTDGSHVFVAQNDELLIVKSWPAADSELVSRLQLDGYAWGLFLHGDHALVVSASYGGIWFEPMYQSATRLHLVDVSDTSAPQVVRSIDIDGDFVGARMVDGHVYVIIRTYMDLPDEAWDLIWRDDLDLPEVPWDATDEEREAAAEIAREILRPYVEAIAADLTLEEMVPLVSDSAEGPDGAARALLGCAEVYVPAETSSYSVLSVVHLNLDAPSPAEDAIAATGLMADGWTVYASSRSIYVAQSSWWWWWGWGELDMTTAIHRFDLEEDGDRPVRYAATGEVPGWLLNQFSMSEHDGYLRVATTEFDWWWGTSADGDDTGSIVTVLADDDAGGLAQVGQVGGIAPGERIYATRFLGTRGYLVTFIQVDPLFTLDLSDPSDPRVVGELVMPGFSSYLHPVGDDYLLAVGMAGEDDGTITGLAVNLFDVSDFSSPTLAHQYTIESSATSWSWSEALSDHHAFTFHRGVLSIPAYLYDGWTSFSGLIVLAVDPEAGIAELGMVDHSDLSSDGEFPWMRRSLYMEDYLYSLSSLGIKVTDLFDPQVLYATVPFYPTGGMP